MMSRQKRFGSGVCGLLLLALAVQAEEEYPQPLAPEPLMVSETLPVPYPASFAVVHDFGFGSLIDSSFGLVDTATGRFRGMMSAGNFATIDASATRREFYIGETYYSRGTRGDRSDLVTVYDMETLERAAEIELPPRRAAIVINKGATGVTASDRFMLVFNLTPATSVSVVDLDERRVVNEIRTPGCSLVYPTVDHDFFMLCSNGAALHISLDDEGQVSARSRSDVFIDIEADPLSEKSSKIGNEWFFVSFKGRLQSVLATGKPGASWSLLNDEERDAGWRPAGWHWTAGHPDGLLWVGMTPDGYNGSHKDPAPEVWLFDVREQRRLTRITLKAPAMAIDVSLERQPRLLVVNASGALDVYDAKGGDYFNSIPELGASPLQVHRLQ